MTEPAWLAAAAGSALLGMGWLALSLPNHWQQVTGNSAESPLRARLLRLMGGIALLLSAGFCLQADHASMAVLVGIMLYSVAAVTVAMLLSWRPAWLRWICPGVTRGKAGRLQPNE